MVGSTPTSFVLVLLKEFVQDLRVAKTINQLALSTGKAYPNTHATTNTLLAEGILTKEVIGHSHRCKLNLQNDKTLIYLSLLETIKRDELLQNNTYARELLKKIDKQSAQHGILLAWLKKETLLLVTTHQQQTNSLFGMPTTTLSLQEFLHNKELCATIAGTATLLFGHALYVGLLKENSKKTTVPEVFS